MFKTRPLFISAVLVYKSLISTLEQQTVCSASQSGDECGPLFTSGTELQDSWRLVELLQQSAVEYLTTYRQLTARQFASLVTMVTTDFEALCAFKHGDYQRCLQLSRQNVRVLLPVARMMGCFVQTSPVFTQLFDDDFVSLIALTMIVDENPLSTANSFITPLTLSLYLMTHCQLKLCHPVSSVAMTLEYIEVAQKRMLACQTLDHLTLKLASGKILIHLTMNI